MTNNDLVMGIDPGVSGAITWMSSDGRTYESRILKPLTEKDIFDYIAEDKERVVCAFLEKVTATTSYREIDVVSGVDQKTGDLIIKKETKAKEGAKSIWTFSGSYHGLRMALIGAGIRFVEVIPFVWQSKMKCRTKGNKNVSKSRAQELFPNIKVTHGNADSLLIAEYGRKYGL